MIGVLLHFSDKVCLLLQLWANISASGATSIDDLNNSTLHFTDVNGSSLSGTTSEVVKQMVPAPHPPHNHITASLPRRIVSSLSV